MSYPPELTFQNVIGTYNAFWKFGGDLAGDPRVGDADNWLSPFRLGLRGMLARIFTVDQNYLELHKFQSQASADLDPNEWVMRCEAYAAVIFFGMESAIECFVFAMNAIGFRRSPLDFHDITDAKSLRRISLRYGSDGRVNRHRLPEVR